jgi:hypothetical protein
VEDLVTGYGRGRDDVARLLGLHVREHRCDSVEHTSQVDVDHAIPFVNLQPLDGRKRHHAGVIDEHVDAPELLDRGVRQLPHVLLLRDVSGNSYGFATSPGDLRHERLDARGAACRNDDVGALRRQMAGSGFAGRRSVVGAT